MKNLNFIGITMLFIIFIAKPINAQDWANLGRFKDANSQLQIPTDNENRVVFMGNSITEGWLQDKASFFYSKPYINRGIGGQTTPQMLIRFRADVIDLKPSIVIILAGINDIAGNTGPSTIEMISNNIMSMVELAEPNGIKVILCSVLPAFDFPWNPGTQPAEKVVELNKWIKTYSDRKGIIYLDYFTAMVDKRNGLKDELTYDGIHPNITGYKVMAPLAEEAIDKALMQE